MHPSIWGTYCKMHSAFICQTIYVGRERLGGESKKKCRVSYCTSTTYIEEKSIKMAYGPLGNSTTSSEEYRKKIRSTKTRNNWS